MVTLPAKAHVVIVSNPFEPFKDTEVAALDFSKGQKYTIRGWLKKRFPGFKEFSKPTICLHNGKPLKRRQWNKRIRPGDTVNFVTVVGDPITVLYVIVAIVAVASIAIALSIKVPTNLTGDTPAADPTYTLKGQRNQVRLGQPIEVRYGKPRFWPSYCAQAYNQYIDNQQWLYQLFCIGQGKYTIHDINIEDTPIADFQDVEWEIIPPGSPVTLFPTNVVTSAEVGGIELLGPNEGGAGSWVVDSEGDDTVDPPIPETGHYNASSAGPFVLNPSGTKTNKIEVDFQLPRGLYTQGNDGTLNNLTVSALVEVQEIDDAGTPLGAWTTLQNWTVTRNTITPQRYTLSGDVALGRYRIRASRTSNKDTSAKSGNTLIWEAARAFIPEDTVDNGITRLAVKARASNNLNDNSASRINVVATRNLFVYAEGAWSLTEEPTRSAVWAFVDAFKAQYGARLADLYLDLDALAALDLTLADRLEFFDWSFEQKTTVWDIARTIAAVCRAVPMLNGSRITMIRDDVKTFPVAVFNQENIIQNSFKWGIKLAELNQYDGLLLVYTDPVSWKEESVLCCLDDEEGNNPEQRKVVGITGRGHAYHLGMYLRAYDRLVRESFEFATGMEGHIPSYGDLVSVAHDVPRWDKGGFVVGMEKEYFAGPAVWQYRLTLSEPCETFAPGERQVLIRSKNGDAIGPYYVGIVDNTGNKVVFTNNATEIAALDALVFTYLTEKPIYLLGMPENVGKQIVVNSLASSEQDEVTVVGRPYDARLFANDDATPPAAGETHGHLPDKNALPAVSGLRVVPAPINTIDGGVGVAASWFAMPGATSYLVQYSYDAKNWNDVGETTDLNITFQVAQRYLYVRVAALNTAQGDWAYWTGQAPITDTTVCAPPTLVVLSSAGLTIIQSDGTVQPRLKVEWTQPADELVKAQGFVRIQYKLASDPDLPENWIDWGTVQGSQTFDYILSVRVGVTYNVRVRSENKFGGKSVWATPAGGSHTVIGDTTAPDPATGLSVTAQPGYNEVEFTASPSADVFEYRVYRNTVNNSLTATAIGENSGTFFDDADVVAGQTYHYWVAAIDGSENEGAKTYAGSAVAKASLADVAPTAPTAATLTGSGTYVAGDGSVFAYLEFSVPALPANARWQNLLYRRNVSGDYMVAAQLKNTGATIVRIDDLSPGVSYQVATQSWSSSQGSALTAATSSPFTAPNDAGAPNAPTGLAAVVGTGKVVSLDWNDNTEPDFSEYGVYRSTDNVTFTKIAETRSSRFVDTDVTLGQLYYYKVTAYDRTENQSAYSSTVSATPSVVGTGSVDTTTAPSNPAAATLNSSSFYTASDGTTFSRLLINVPAMPAGAILLNVMFRRSGQAGWIVADQRSSGGGTSSIDDLSPGEAYEIACQAFNAFGVGSAIVSATGSPFTAPSKNSGPATPTGGNLSADGVTPKFITGTKVFLFGCNIGWNSNTESDFSHYEVKGTLTDSDAATDYSWTVYDQVNFVAKPRVPQVILYNATLAAGYIRVRAVNRSGVASAWLRIGNANSFSSLGTGNLAAQSTTDVAVTALKVGNGSSVRQIRTIYDENGVVTLAGGSPTENVNVSLTNRGFAAQPDVGVVQVVDPPGDLEVFYAWSNGSNSSTNAVLTFKTADGSNIGAGPRRYNLHLVEYA